VRRWEPPPVPGDDGRRHGTAPGVELRGAAQRLTGADAATALLGVMDDEHGNVMPALQLAQVSEQRGDLAAGVLVDAVETYERIEDEQARRQSGDGLGEVAAVGIQIEPDGRRSDNLDVEIGQRHTGCCRDSFEASAHAMQCVLRGKEQDATGTARGTAKRRRHGTPAATATARSKARNDLQHFGSPPTMPTACSDHRLVISQRCSSERSARRYAGSTGSRVIGADLRSWARPRAAWHRSPGTASHRSGGPRAPLRRRATRRRCSCRVSLVPS
jgi:hypothetical protein